MNTDIYGKEAVCKKEQVSSLVHVFLAHACGKQKQIN